MLIFPEPSPKNKMNVFEVGDKVVFIKSDRTFNVKFIDNRTPETTTVDGLVLLVIGIDDVVVDSCIQKLTLQIITFPTDGTQYALKDLNVLHLLSSNFKLLKPKVSMRYVLI